MADVLRALREYYQLGTAVRPWKSTGAMIAAAADEIERLRSLIALRERECRDCGASLRNPDLIFARQGTDLICKRCAYTYECDEALELRDHYSAENVKLQQELDHYRDVLRKMLAAKGDHMTACDKTMGGSHPCTCGANEARQLVGGKRETDQFCYATTEELASALGSSPDEAKQVHTRTESLASGGPKSVDEEQTETNGDTNGN